MKIHALFFTALALCLSACGKQDPAEPEQAAPAEVAADKPQVDQAFIDHMHAHAEQLDELMFALADEDLEGALTPAYWLSRHDTAEGIPDEWQQHVTGMREAAAAVGAADDLETARTAAESISTHCQACHEAAGINEML